MFSILRSNTAQDYWIGLVGVSGCPTMWTDNTTVGYTNWINGHCASGRHAVMTSASGSKWDFISSTTTIGGCVCKMSGTHLQHNIIL